MLSEEQLSQNRQRMVNDLRQKGITDHRILSIMRRIPRHLFLPHALRDRAYEDSALPIGQSQTIPQPFVSALMAQSLMFSGIERILEIGTGCGYQTAVLCELCAYVYTLERSPILADRAAKHLEMLDYSNVDLHIGDGSQGLPDMKPFDAILVSGAVPLVPSMLVAQLNPDGGRLLIPVGERNQQHLHLVQRYGNKCNVKKGPAVRFLPLIGRYGFDSSPGSSYSAGV